MVVVVSRDVMTGVAAAYYNCLFPLGIRSRSIKSGGVNQTVAFEVIDAFNIGW